MLLKSNFDLYKWSCLLTEMVSVLQTNFFKCLLKYELPSCRAVQLFFLSEIVVLNCVIKSILSCSHYYNCTKKLAHYKKKAWGWS